MSSSRAPIAHLNIASFDDPRLRQLQIGVQMIGNDAQNTPPTHALARRGIVDNVRGYLIYGDYRTANPPAAIVDAVAKGDVDVAVVWGPLAGYFAAREPELLDVTPVSPAWDGPQWPMVFDIAMGVRSGDTTFKHDIDAALHAIVRRSRLFSPRITSRACRDRLRFGQERSNRGNHREEFRHGHDQISIAAESSPSESEVSWRQSKLAAPTYCLEDRPWHLGDRRMDVGRYRRGRASIATIKPRSSTASTLIDTAPVYGFGRSEEIVGKALADAVCANAC